MDNIWHQVPFLRLLLPFVLGILLGIYVQAPQEVYGLIFPIWLAVIGLSYRARVHHRYRYRWLYGGAVFLLFFTAGYLLCLGRIEHLQETHYTHAGPSELVLARVVDTPVSKKRSVKLELELTALYGQGEWKAVQGRSLLYVQKDSTAVGLRYGDELLVRSRLNGIPEPANPEEFNYKRYLYFHQIYRQGYVRSAEWQLIARNKGNPLIQLTQDWRQEMLAAFRALPFEQQELGVVSALVLGYKGDLDQSLKKAYSSAGAMHVLAVSGLHVGIIFLIINSMLKFLGNSQKGRILRTVLLVVALWLYAALTGLSASVMRASTMFSFIIIAQATGRQANIYNTLAVSALFLLLINPFLITEVGFQLSYLAVIGIVFLQPRIYRFFAFRSWLADKVWAITAVSIAAQLATFPLGLLYFHQFPNYFLVSNLVVIPAATVILYSGLLLLVLTPIQLLAEPVALALKYFIQTLNTVIGWIEALPYALYQGASISVVETWLIYLLIGNILAFAIRKQWHFGRMALFLAIGLLGFRAWEKQEQLQQHRIVVYDVNKTPAIDLIAGNRSVLISHPDFYQDESRLLFHVQHHWWARGIDQNQFVPVKSLEFKGSVAWTESGFIQFQHKRLALIDSLPAVRPEQKIPLDFLILTGNPKGSLKKLTEPYAFEEVIFDSSNPSWTVKRWVEEAEEAGFAYHAVPLEGAWIKDLDGLSQ